MLPGLRLLRRMSIWEAWFGPRRLRKGEPLWCPTRRPRLPRREGRSMLDGARAPYSGPTSTMQREGPDSSWTTRRRITSGKVWTHAVGDAELLSW